MKSCLSLFNSMSPFSRKKVYGGEGQDQDLLAAFMGIAISDLYLG